MTKRKGRTQIPRAIDLSEAFEAELLEKEEYPGEGTDLVEALTVLREWVADVQGKDQPLYMLLDQAVSTRDLGFMRIARDAWDELPEFERARILRLSNLTIH